MKYQYRMMIGHTYVKLYLSCVFVHLKHVYTPEINL